jgi:type VI protein secretion system component VasK
VRIEPGSTPQRTLLAFDVEGRRARFELRSSTGAVHPLVRQELERFQCPKQP